VAVNKRLMEKGSSSNVNVNIVAANKGSTTNKASQEARTAPNANRFAYRNNYKGKNPMTRTQWRRFQRKKRLAKPKMDVVVQKVEFSKRQVKERLEPIVEEKDAEDEKDVMDDEPIVKFGANDVDSLKLWTSLLLQTASFLVS
jgi:hypothetical protein